MSHIFMEQVASGLYARGIATLRFQFPFMEKGSKRPDSPAIAHAAIRAETTLLSQMSPQHLQVMVDKSPMGRLGTTAEVAEMTKWLCSDSCSFCTGAIFDLSGGRASS